MYKFNKYLYTFIFSMISVLVFLIDYKMCDSIHLSNDSLFVNFFVEIYQSIKNFDIIYVALWVFIFNFYYDIYFDSKKYGKINFLWIGMSIFFSIFTVIGNSYLIDNTLHTLYSSVAQIFKTVIFLLGYNLIYYAIIKKFFIIKYSFEFLKKKVQF